MYSSLSSGRTIETEKNFEYSRPHGYCSDRWWNHVLVLQQKKHTLFSLKEKEMLGGIEAVTKVCGETAGYRDGVQSRCTAARHVLLYAYIETLFSYAIPVTKQ